MKKLKKYEGMRLGCGIDRESYAMAYAKARKLPIIGCGVVGFDEVQTFTFEEFESKHPNALKSPTDTLNETE